MQACWSFTLIELLVVVPIIALLISILLPSLQSALEQGKRADCLSNMRGIGGASHDYSGDNIVNQRNDLPNLRPLNKYVWSTNAGIFLSLTDSA